MKRGAVGRAVSGILAACALLVAATPAQAAREFQYFVFPLESILGIGKDGKSGGSMIDPQALDEYLLPLTVKGRKRDGEAELQARFSQKIREAYPAAAVHPLQIARVGEGAKYQFAQASGCDASRGEFRAAISDSYAAALALTRVSLPNDANFLPVASAVLLQPFSFLLSELRHLNYNNVFSDGVAIRFYYPSYLHRHF